MSSFAFSVRFAKVSKPDLVWKIYKNSPSYCLLLTLRNSVRKSVYVQCSGTLNSWLPCTCHPTSAAHHECSSLAALKLTHFSYATVLLHTLHWLPVTAQISQVSGPCLYYSHKRVRGPTSVTECEETDKDEKMVLKKGYSTLVFCK